MNAVVKPGLTQSDAMRFQALNAQAIKAVQEGIPGKALPFLREALSIYEEPAVLSNYGDALARSGAHEEAKAAFRRSLELAPDYDQAAYNLGVCCEETGDIEEAYEAYKRALGNRVTAATLNNLGNAEMRLLKLADAEDHYRKATKERFDAGRWNLGLCLMAQRKWREGWDWYEFRPQMKDMAERPTKWRGEKLEGKTLVIVTEQGLGDTVFAMRYIPVLKARGARLIVFCDPPLVRLMKTFDVEVIEKNTAVPQSIEFHYETMMMSIPGYLTPEGHGPTEPYLRVPAARAGGGDYTVGLCWNGSTVVGAPAERNIPLKLLAPLAAIEGVKLVSLQKGNAVDEMADCGFPVHDAMANAHDVYDTAQVIASLDLVITVDTLIPHLAGALGVPTWLMDRFASCWQWGAGETHLYQTVAQFRQQRRGDWASVVAHVAAGLEHVVAARRAAEEAAP